MTFDKELAGKLTNIAIGVLIDMHRLGIWTEQTWDAVRDAIRGKLVEELKPAADEIKRLSAENEALKAELAKVKSLTLPLERHTRRNCAPEPEDDCPACDGSGWYWNDFLSTHVACSRCRGSGVDSNDSSAGEALAQIADAAESWGHCPVCGCTSEREAAAPRCSVCGSPATKWDGGIPNHTSDRKRLPPQFRCDEHDPYNKWFALCPVCGGTGESEGRG